jgi:hypothetical protein
MVSFVYNIAKAGFANGTEDWDSAGFLITLVSTYAADPDDTAASFFSGTELDGSNHTSGFGGTIRKSLGSPAVTQNDTDDQAELDADNVTWTAIDAGQACAAVVLRQSGTDALSPLICYIDDGFGIVTNGGDFTISFANSGVMKLASNA